MRFSWVCPHYIKLKIWILMRTENAVEGEALIHFGHEELREMGITSVGHRISILKKVYQMKIAHGVPIEPEHYVPVSM